MEEKKIAIKKIIDVWIKTYNYALKNGLDKKLLDLNTKAQAITNKVINDLGD